jgi:hypothetical protein
MEHHDFFLGVPVVIFYLLVINESPLEKLMGYVMICFTAILYYLEVL